MSIKHKVQNIVQKNGFNHKVVESIKSTEKFNNGSTSIYRKIFASTHSVLQIYLKMISNKCKIKKFKFGPDKFMLEIAHDVNEDLGYYYNITLKSVTCTLVDINDNWTELKVQDMTDEEKFEQMLLHPLFIPDLVNDEFLSFVRKIAKKNKKYLITIRE